MECVRCVCVGLGRRVRRGGEWMKGLGLGFTNHVGTGGVLDVCLGCGGVGGLGGQWGVGRRLDAGLEGWCYVFVSCDVWIICVDGRSRYLYIVLGG